MTRTFVSVVAIALMHAHSVHLSSQALEHLVYAAKWTSAHSVLAVLRKTEHWLSLKSMAVTVYQKVSYQLALRCVQPKP